MTEFEKGYEQGYKDGVAGAALPNVNDNGGKIDGYSYAYKTDSNGEPYIHIDSVRGMLKKSADVQPVKHGRWLNHHAIWIDQPKIEGWFVQAKCSECEKWAHVMNPYTKSVDYECCPHCGARMDGGAENDNNG